MSFGSVSVGQMELDPSEPCGVRLSAGRLERGNGEVGRWTIRQPDTIDEGMDA